MNGVPEPAPGAPALARFLLDSGEPAPSGLTATEREALAWALKDLCYAAWNSEPQRAARAAIVLAGLRTTPDKNRNAPIAPPAEAPPPDALPSLEALHGTTTTVGDTAPDVVDALAHWTDGIAGLTRGRMAEAATAFDAAADIFRALGRTRDAAQTQVPKIMALAMLGRHAAAAACAEETQRAFVALGDSGAAGRVALNLGSLHLRRDDFRQAIRHYREAAVLFARVGDREHSIVADIGAGDALTSLGDFAEAGRIYARAAMRASTHGFPVLDAMVEESVALLRLARGDYRDALAGFESSRRRYEALAMPQHLAIAEKQLADAYLEVNLLPEALALYDKALGRFRALDMPDDEAWTLAQKGRALALRGDAAAAAVALEAAGAAFAAQDNGVGAAAVALAGAELALLRDDAPAALALATTAEQGYAAADIAERTARAAVVRAHALLRLGNLDEARALFDATLAQAETLELLHVQVRCLTGQGLAARALGDAPRARERFIAAASLFEEARRTLPGDEIRSAFLTDHLRPYRELLRLALDDHAASGTRADARAVLVHADRLRARTLDERLADGLPARDEPAESSATADLRARLNWLYRRVRRLQDEGDPSAALAAEVRSTEHALLERARRERLAAGPSLAAFAAEASDLDVDALQAALHEGDALVEYGVIDDELFACVVTRDAVAIHRRVAGWNAVLEAARSTRFQIESLAHGAGPVARHMATLTARARARLHALHALIWAPLEPSLAGVGRVLLVAHGALGALPFTALHDGERYLSERCALAFAPSARLALRGLGLAGGPFTQRAHALVLGESSRLPHAAAEARSVASFYADPDVFVGVEATLSALRSHAAAADVIHLACHAQFRSDNPLFSALHLADGALTVEAAEALALRACTVVLSACETGLAEQGEGNEMTGLVRGFLAAGAARVVASLWPVDDETTARFMAAFHGALSHGDAPSTALRAAQAQMREGHPHPYYWAPFVLHGAW